MKERIVIPKSLLWCLKVLSYGLLFCGGGVVFVGSVYVLFFASLEDVAPDSLNRNTPFMAKMAMMGFQVVVIAGGYLINRIVWTSLERSDRR